MLLAPGDIALDYATQRPDPARMAAAGVKAVVRYISVSPTGPSDMQRPEVDTLHAAGIGVLAVFEEQKNSSLGGRLIGIGHGNAARANLLRLGYPLNVPVIVAVQDTSLTPTQWPFVADYTAGFQQAVAWPGGLMVYGGTKIGNYVTARVPGLLGIWKAGAGDWSVGQPDTDVLVEQHFGYIHPSVAALGVIVDDNTVRKPLTVWDGKETNDMAKLIRDSRSGEIDVTDFVTSRRDPAHGITDVPTRIAIANAWAQVLGPWEDVPALVWDNIPVYTPPVAAAAVNIPPQLTHVTFQGSGVLSP